MGKSKSIGIISIKGGVGKTTAVLNLAHSLSNDYGKKVLVIDANFSSPNVALHLGNVDVKNSIRDVLNQKVKPSAAIYENNLGYHVLPSSLDSIGNNNFTHASTPIFLSSYVNKVTVIHFRKMT